MGKISQVSSKYIVHATIDIDGIVERPDVIGAIFGQTEGLLGADLELRELQRSGRIGRIEVTVDTRSGKSQGSIIMPSSLDKAETSIVGAALEVIQRIGPCNAKLKVQNIEDVRVSKRKLVIDRAKELLKQMTDNVLPDSQELSDEVAYSVRVMEIQQYGKDRLPAGPAVDDSDELIVVEGRADVLNLLKHGFKNVIAMNGTSVPDTIKELSKKKELIAFVDGDRGGNLIIKELTQVTDLDFVARAPDGKEVEEITKKEIHMAIRGKIAAEQAKMEMTNGNEESKPAENRYRPRPAVQSRPIQSRSIHSRPSTPTYRRPSRVSDDEKTKFKSMLEDLIGTRGAYILDDDLNIMGKVPITEMATTVKSLNTGIKAIVFDGMIDKSIVDVAESARVKFLVAMKSKVESAQRVNLLTGENL
ncbi:DNA primase [Candidatus Woesearchaeota archaeon]|nr:DNA primase [Candidatus Woesearchaeota archaeon]